MLRYYGQRVPIHLVGGSMEESEIVSDLSIIASAIMDNGDRALAIAMLDGINEKLRFLGIPIYLDVYGDRERVIVDVVQGPITYPFTREQVQAVREMRKRLVQHDPRGAYSWRNRFM